ncbi:unnamed protein product [Sphenostylis stenocarpa]|uniref:Uncharacterized protein n=1 Tax=Sphenostylis stenocarpa TaxID=92480 RepID=A0AA86RUE7_9FABA|nr:unnamed protein product [Sphenostylis stenocarpa]
MSIFVCSFCLVPSHRRDHEPIGNEEGIFGIQHHNPPRGRHTRGIFTLLSLFAFKYPCLLIRSLSCPCSPLHSQSINTLSTFPSSWPVSLSSKKFEPLAGDYGCSGC